MRSSRGIKYQLGLIVLLFFNIIGLKGNAQYPGSMMMFQDNYYSQMMNPAYMRSDKATTLVVPVLGGLSVKNAASFRISDLINVSSENKPELDFERFYNKSRANNFIGTSVSVPLIYINTPANNGFFTFYYQERAQMLSRFSSSLLEYVNTGNIPVEYRNYSSEKINSVGLGFKEFSFGYALKQNEQLSFGFRGKILFGNFYYLANDWEYGIHTSENGDKVTLSSSGSGQMYVPVPVYLGRREQVYYIDGSNKVGNYLSSFSNPGLALDFGFIWNIDKSREMSFALRDLGGIWFRKDGLDLKLDNSYDFTGFDLENAIRYLDDYGYVNPLTSMLNTKEEIRDVYRPLADSTRFAKFIPPQTVFHYQVKTSPRYEFGITNQTVFQKKLLYNSTSFTALQKWANFSVFESVNIHQLSSIALGGGFQYTGEKFQVFLAADNLIAFYHPAKNKTLSLTFGMSFLFNHKKNATDSNGMFLPHLPFYRILD
ncbi:MAG: hypothetical protein JXR61_02020 [Prolixibacteraceae bacterium]|nr:hypothetical protein [Prolixibacteraceae bacterium]